MSFKSFSVGCMGVILLAFGAIGIFNYVVDPFWYFRVVEVKGFNLDKPRAGGSERLVKPALVVKLQPEAVIVGTSFAEIGLPPTHSGFTEHGTYSSFNLSLHGIGWDEIYCLARFAIDRAHVKRLVVTVQGSRDANCPSEIEFGRVDYSKLLFSRNALDASFATLRNQDGRPYMTREGLWYLARYEDNMQSDDAVARHFASELRDALCPSARGNSRADDRLTIDKSPTAQDQGAGLRKLIRLAIEKKVDLVLVFNPTHLLFNEIARRCDGPAIHWQFLWQVVSIVDEETAGNPDRVPVWDFYAYQAINGERVHAGKPMRERLWQDAGHYNHEVGSRAFDAIYSGVQGFGSRVTVRNFDQFVASTEDERRAFLADNPWVSPEIDEIYARHGASLPASGNSDVSGRHIAQYPPARDSGAR